eukprot:jgi/Bigna1/76585/fgenesh1_pg.42_\
MIYRFEQTSAPGARTPRISSRFKFMCGKCKRPYGKEESYLQHVAACNVSVRMNLACPTCPKRFFLHGKEVETHILQYHGDTARLYPCPIQHCRKEFQFDRYLRTPFALHPYHGELEAKTPVQICNSKFKRMTDLSTHYLTHTGDKPFNCSLCSKTFRQRAHLKGHIKRKHDVDVIRLKQRHAVICRFCGLSFGRNSSRTKHMKEMHKIDELLGCGASRESNDDDAFIDDIVRRHERGGRITTAATSPKLLQQQTVQLQTRAYPQKWLREPRNEELQQQQEELQRLGEHCDQDGRHLSSISTSIRSNQNDDARSDYFQTLPTGELAADGREEGFVQNCHSPPPLSLLDTSSLYYANTIAEMWLGRKRGWGMGRGGDSIVNHGSNSSFGVDVIVNMARVWALLNHLCQTHSNLISESGSLKNLTENMFQDSSMPQRVTRNSDKIECPHCGHPFSRHATLLRHVFSHHDVPKTSEVDGFHSLVANLQHDYSRSQKAFYDCASVAGPGRRAVKLCGEECE